MIGEDSINLDSESQSHASIFHFAEIQRPTEARAGEPSLDEKLWVSSLTEIPCHHQFKLALDVKAFIVFNAVVNAFSLLGSLAMLEIFKSSDAEKKSPTLITVIVFASIATFIANLLSKFTEVGNPTRALNLTKKQSTFFNNLRQKLAAIDQFEGKIIVGLNPQDKLLFSANPDHGTIPKTLVNALQLLQSEYNKSTNQELDFIDTDNLHAYCENYSTEYPDKPLNLLTDCEDITNLPATVKIISFYPNGWLSRLYTDVTTKPLTKSTWTTTKALLTFLRWNITIGIPSIVVLLTGIKALSKIENVSHRTSAQRLLFLLINLYISGAKMQINCGLKQELTDIEIQRMIEMTWHHQPTHFKMKEAFASFITNLISMFPYVVTTAYYYSEEGPKTFIRELNAIFGSSIPTPTLFLSFFTWAAVITSVPTAFATSLLPFYNVLVKGIRFNDHKAREAMKQYPTRALLFYVCTTIDSIFFGVNARFNTIKTLTEPQQQASSTTEIIAGTVGSGVAILAIFWCLFKGTKKFGPNMHLLNRIFHCGRMDASKLKENVPLHQNNQNGYISINGDQEEDHGGNNFAEYDSAVPYEYRSELPRSHSMQF